MSEQLLAMFGGHCWECFTKQHDGRVNHTYPQRQGVRQSSPLGGVGTIIV